MTQTSATNRKSIREATRDAAIYERDRINFLVSAMGLPQGRLFFYALLEQTHCFVNNPTFDAHRDYFDFGQRNIGLALFNDIMSHCPQHYQTMIGEQYERLNAAAARQRSSSPRRDGNVEGASIEHDDSGVDYNPYDDLADADGDPS